VSGVTTGQDAIVQAAREWWHDCETRQPGRGTGIVRRCLQPRIVARMNQYDVKIAHVKGEHIWHVHNDTDEFFLVLDGSL
jgi:mannose-6-phosphate isomerase-like protein (cupin superfamily)